MKKIIGIMLITASCLAVTAAPELPVQLEPRIPRKINIGTSPQLEMVKNGKVNFEIVVPANASPGAKFGGTEAATLLGKAFGTKLQVLQTASGKCPAIIIGSPAHAEKLGVDVKGLDRDGFVIKTFPGGVLIIGQDDPNPAHLIRGTHASLFGTYDFLERFAGMRFYLAGDYGTVVPKKKDWSLPSIDIYERPDLYNRRYSDYRGNPGTLFKEDVRKTTRLRNRYQTARIYFPHSLRYLTYGVRFGKSHPEYFAVDERGKRIIDPGYTRIGDNSHFCYSSDFKKEVIADAISYLKGEPASVRGIINPETGKTGWHWSFPKGLKIFTLSPPDCIRKCHCPECTPDLLNGNEKKQHEHYWRFFRDVAQAVKDAGVEGYILVPCSYGWWAGMPPSFPLPDNMIFSFATPGPWSELTPHIQNVEFARLKAWANAGKNKPQLWTYPGKYNGEFPGIPTCTPRYDASFIKRAKPYTVGCYFETHTDQLFFNYLSFYIYGKILWNPDVDVEKLLDEHAKAMFGPAAKPMKEFFDTIERNWMKLAGNTVNTNLGPVAIFPSEREMWSTVYSPAERKRISGLFAEAEKLTAKTPEYRVRVKTLYKEMWEPALKAADNFFCDARAVADWGAYMPETAEAPVIDGKLDDPAWKQAEVITLIPKKNVPCEVRTTVRALRDKDYFYFGFDCEDKGNPIVLIRPFDNRDIWKDAGVEVFLSPDKNTDRSYQVLVNAAGSISDLTYFKGVEDWSWNSKAEAKSVMTPGKGWITEIRIPRSSLPPAATGMLANFTRRYTPKNKNSVSYVWGPFYARHNNEIHHFGTLRFQPETKKNLIPDGDFEGKPDPKRSHYLGKWRWFGCDKIFPVTTDYIVSGKQAALLDSKRFLNNHWAVLRTLPPVKPGKEYILTFFARLEKVKPLDKEGGFYVNFDDFDNRMKYYPAKGTARFTGSFPWTPMEFRFKTSSTVLPKDIPGPGINFALRKAEGKVWIDHVRLVEVKK